LSASPNLNSERGRRAELYTIVQTLVRGIIMIAG